MKTVKADPTHAYHVFKLLKEYAEDVGTKKPTVAEFDNIVADLLDKQKLFSIIMHGRQAAGMVWGTASKEGFIMIEGRFLRRRFRNFRFKRQIVKETLAAKKNFGKLRLLLPPQCKVSPRYKSVGLIVEGRT